MMKIGFKFLGCLCEVKCFLVYNYYRFLLHIILKSFGARVNQIIPDHLHAIFSLDRFQHPYLHVLWSKRSYFSHATVIWCRMHVL